MQHLAKVLFNSASNPDQSADLLRILLTFLAKEKSQHSKPEPSMIINLHWGDFVALGGYFVVIIGIGIWSSCQNRGSVDGYFVARRTMHFIPVGCWCTRTVPRRSRLMFLDYQGGRLPVCQQHWQRSFHRSGRIRSCIGHRNCRFRAERSLRSRGARLDFHPSLHQVSDPTLVA